MQRRLFAPHAQRWRWCARGGTAHLRTSAPKSTCAPSPSSSTYLVTWCAARRLHSTHATGPTPAGASDDASDLIWGALPDESAGQVGGVSTSSSRVAEPDTTTAASAAEASPSAEPRQDSGGPADNENAEATDPPSAEPSASSPSSSSVWVTLHNMPRNWLHEEIAEMIHHVAAHAGIAAPNGSSAARDRDSRDDDGEDGEGDVMTSRVSSPFIQRLHIPFGRRTGLVYGTPKLLLTSRALADYLVRDLNFDPDDFRSRVYFTHTTPAELPAAYRQDGSDGAGDAAGLNGGACVQYAPIEETVEREQDEALRTLELDRYLFAPDLLLDIAKSHQRRLVTRNEKVLLDAFVDGDEDDDDGDGEVAAEDAVDTAGDREGDEGEASDGGGATASRQKDRRRRRRSAGAGGRARRRSRAGRPARAGTLKHLGRGSMHNMPIPKPYVEGRQL